MSHGTLGRSGVGTGTSARKVTGVYGGRSLAEMVSLSVPTPATLHLRPSRITHCALSDASGSVTSMVARSIAMAQPPATTCQLKTDRSEASPLQLEDVPDSTDAGASAPGMRYVMT